MTDARQLEHFRSERGDPAKHDVSEFTCGVASLDVWLKEYADTSAARRTARTWVWVDPRGAGYGAVLVADALERIVTATRVVAARVVVVDAREETVAQFYERLGFRRIPGSLRLVQKIADVEAALGRYAARGA